MMKKTIFSALLVFTFAAQAAPTADEIARQAFITSKVADSTSDSTFRLINDKGQERLRETTGVSKLLPGTLDNQRYVLFKSPSDVKNTATLLVEHSKGDDDIWIYLPALKKVRRLVSSDKKSSFVGTDFSYGDVIGHKVEDWNHKILREEKVDGVDTWVLESLPKNPSVVDNSGYSKRISWIAKDSYIAVKGELYDPSGALLKKLTQTDVKLVDEKNKKYQAMKLQAENVQTGHKTILEFKNYKANVGVKNDYFKSQNLDKGL
jgi:outer membrane lipoprotein-sorting protein